MQGIQINECIFIRMEQKINFQFTYVEITESIFTMSIQNLVNDRNACRVDVMYTDSHKNRETNNLPAVLFTFNNNPNLSMH